MSAAASSTPARLDLVKEMPPVIRFLPVIENEADDDDLEMPRKACPWMTKANQGPTPLTTSQAPQGSPIEEESETEDDSSDEEPRRYNDFAIASDDEEELWMDSASASLNNDMDHPDLDSLNYHEDPLNFKRLPPGAYRLRKSTSMLSLGFKFASMNGKPPTSRMKASRPFLSLRRTHTADGLGVRGNYLNRTAGHSGSSRLPPDALAFDPNSDGRVPSAFEVRRQMLQSELTEDERRVLDLERRWPWGRGEQSPASLRHKSLEREKLSEMFSKPPQEEPYLSSWGAPLQRKSEGDNEARSQGGQDNHALIFKCPTCSW